MKRTMAAALAALLAVCFLLPAAAEEAGTPAYGEDARRYLYVSVSGSDEKGDGTLLSPFGTPHRAAEAALPGDTIRLGAGIYDIVTPIELPVGVSLEGEGESTVLTSSTLTEEMGGEYALLRLVSPVGEGGAKVSGDQHVSHLRFDGAGTATQAIEIRDRCSVAVHDCVITGFVHVGVGWRASDTGDGTPPEHYVTGGRFYNNYMKDNSFYGPDAWGSVYGRGALFCGGLKDFEIAGCTIIEDCRTGRDGVRGVPVKFWYYNGWMLGCRIHDNTIRRLGSPTFSTDEVGWAFAVESLYHAGMEICGNEFTGAVDLNYGLCGTYDGTEYDYATWMHDNRFTPDPEPREAWGSALYEESAVILEGRTERTLIERNCISGYNQALYFNVRQGVYDLTFRDNFCADLGGDHGSMFRMDGHGEDMEVIGFRVEGNWFEGSPDGMSGFGVIVSQVMGTWSGRDILITGNAVGNTLFSWLVIDGFTAVDGLTVKDNVFYNAGGEYILRSGENIVGYSFSGNEEAGGERRNALREEYRERCSPR